jgi:hypothetical protein
LNALPAGLCRSACCRKGCPYRARLFPQHLKILKNAGLVGNVIAGTRHVYYLDPRGIGVMRAWLERFFLSAQEHVARNGEGA